MKTKYLSNARLCVMSFLLLALVGCGGGGGGGGGNTASNNAAPVANASNRKDMAHNRALLKYLVFITPP